MGLPTLPLIWGRAVMALLVSRVGQNHKYTVHVRYFWQGNHQIYGHIQCIYTVLATPTHIHTHMHTHTHTHSHIHTNAHTHTNTHTRTYAQTHVRMHIHKHTRTQHAPSPLHLHTIFCVIHRQQHGLMLQSLLPCTDVYACLH